MIDLNKFLNPQTNTSTTTPKIDLAKFGVTAKTETPKYTPDQKAVGLLDVLGGQTANSTPASIPQTKPLLGKTTDKGAFKFPVTPVGEQTVKKATQLQEADNLAVSLEKARKINLGVQLAMIGLTPEMAAAPAAAAKAIATFEAVHRGISGGVKMLQGENPIQGETKTIADLVGVKDPATKAWADLGQMLVEGGIANKASGFIKTLMGEKKPIVAETPQPKVEIKPEPVVQEVLPKTEPIADPLLQEARKYKTAEEFADSVLYHGSPDGFAEYDFSRAGLGSSGNAFGTGAYFTDKFKNASDYASGYGSVNAILGGKEGTLGGKVLYTIKPPGDLLDLNKFLRETRPPSFYKEGLKKMEQAGFSGVSKDPNVLQQLKKGVSNESIDRILSRLDIEIANNSKYIKVLGDRYSIYDYFLPKDKFVGAFDVAAQYGAPGKMAAQTGGGAKDFVLWDKGIPIKMFEAKQELTKSQLTDIWKKANEVVPKVVEVVPREVQEGTAKSGVAKSIEAKSIEQGLTEGFKGVAQYDPITIKDQAQKAADLINSNYVKAENILSGKEQLPNDLRAGALIKGMEELALKTKNGELALKVANSPLTAETSLHAQEMRLLAERNPDSATAQIKAIQKAREANAERRTGKKLTQAKQEMAKQIKSEMAAAAPKIKDWAGFIESIKCK